MYILSNNLNRGKHILIEVKNLVKSYGGKPVVDDLSFTVESGQIYGFLGPNGAGKSTTMNILTGYIGMTSGQVTINGYDLLEEPEQVRRSIGYLPEQPPLYTDMTPKEYLDFAAELERFKRTLETAAILGAENMRMFSFYKTNPEDINEVVERIGAFLDVANGSGVDLCHENEKGIFGDVAERCLLLHKALPSLKAVFDPANFVQCGVDTQEAWSLLNPYVKYLHAKDADKNGKVVPCGMGIGNVPYIFGEFAKMGGGVITLEPHLKSFVGLSALEGGDTSAVGGMSFASSDEAFDYAVNAAKNIAEKL